MAIVAALFLVPSVGGAQFIVRSWLPWRTIETPHFAFHYPVELEEWTRDIAERMESVDSAVTRVVGYRVPRTTQVVVDDPYAVANGSAWPFLNQPIVNLWASPPDPREDIGNYRAWSEMLATHEFAHIAHLSRPSRNEWFRRLWTAMPASLGPLAIKAPRWVIEGYATYVEGKVTGSGRPNANWRPALLREWAIEGALPSYDQLDQSGAFMGGDFAYMVGSAYLEWLANRAGDSSLVALWRRMSARQNRGFDDAFTGVFGEGPRTLYGRFTADLTAKSMTVAHALATAGADTGAIVQRLAWATGDPAISPDGKLVALLVRSTTRPSRVVVWGTAPEPDTLRARRDSALRKSDPEDVPARPIYPPPKKVIAALRSVGGNSYFGPRFLADGRIIVWRNSVRRDGSTSPDVYLWTPRGGGVHRVSYGASLRDPDPSPDGRWAVATRCSGGRCDVVRVDLADGRVLSIARGTPRKSYYRPRLDRAGERIVVAVQSRNRWRIAMLDVNSGAERYVDPDDGANRYDAEFVGPNSIVVTSERGDIPNLETIDLTSGATRTLTCVTGAAVAPAPNPVDGSIWFLSLYSRGYDLRRLAPSAGSGAPVIAFGQELVPAIRLVPHDSVLFGRGPVSDPQTYRLTTRSYRWIPVPLFDANGAGGALAVASSDIVGKSELLAQGASGSVGAWRGASLSALWRETPWSAKVSAFGASQRPSRNDAGVPVSPALDARQAGVSLRQDFDYAHDESQTRLRGGVLLSNISHFAPNDTGSLASGARALVTIEQAASWQHRSDVWRLAASAVANFTAGQSAGTRATRVTASAATTLGFGILPPLNASAQVGWVNTDASTFEQFALGGLPSPLIDGSFLSQRIAIPTLPTGTDVGTSLLVYRVAIPLGTLTPYWWAGSTTTSAGRYQGWHRVVGGEWIFAVPTYPLAGTPAARAQVGLGYSLDAPFHHEFRGYAGLIFNP